MKSVTLFVLIGILYSVFITTNGAKECPMKAALAKSIEACQDKLSEENAKLLEEDNFADNEEIQCFRACIMTDAKIMEGKNIDIEKIGALLKDHIKDVPMDDVMEGLKMCKAQAEEGSNECEVAGRFSNCFKDAANDENKE